MKYWGLQKLNDANFRTLTGFKRETFQAMIDVLKEADSEKMKFGGRPPKNCIEDRLLMACQYWREYRSYLHIGVEFGVSVSVVHDTIKWIENTLIKCGKFNLPGKKKLTQSDVQYEIVVIDATETPIHRPKKSKDFGTRERKNDIR